MTAATPSIDPTEPLVPVAQLAQEAFGRRVARTSIWRWCTGRSGSRLPAVIAGGNQWLTTRRCWFEWMKYRTAERLRKAGVPMDVSDAELADAGLGD